MDIFVHILKWTLKRGSHRFPGPDGGTCINEAAVVACGFPYRPVRSVVDMPPCFSRPICRLALHLNDEFSDEERQRLLPFVTRLACADTPEIEEQRAAYIQRAHLNFDSRYPPLVSLDDGIRILEGALAIGRQADPLGLEDAADRMETARREAARHRREPKLVSTKLKAWLGTSKAESTV